MVNKTKQYNHSEVTELPHHGLDPSVHIIITFPSFCLYSRNSAQLLIVDLCSCFHLFLEEGSSFSGVMKIRLVILCFISGIHLYVSIYYICFLVWVTSLRIVLSSSVYLPTNLKMSLIFIAEKYSIV